MMLHAEEWGAGTPLVLLHGFSGSASTWEPARALLGTRHRVIAIDLPGHGGSPAPAPAIRLRDVADALVAVLDRAGVRQAAWLGYSLGGRAGLHVATAHPSRVSRLVLESTSPGIRDAGERATRSAADDALAARLEREGVARFVERWMAQPLFASQARLDVTILARERTVRLAQSAGGLAAALRALGPGKQPPLWEHLPAIGTPALVVAGADDERYAAIATAMAHRLGNGRLAIVPEAGHAVHLENPVPFWSLVCAFLDERRDRSMEETLA
jgi:2-succinyl-6-hydroxy-2,4-cyclohexadiene-1-carboxylate synthase